MLPQQLVTVPRLNIQTATILGVYLRLSVDDPNLCESESIQTQKAYLTDYCRQHGFTIYDFYVEANS